MESKKKSSKFSKLERQVLVMLAILGLVVLISIGAYYALKPKPTYFEYGPFKVYQKVLEGTNVNFYYISFTTAEGNLNHVAFRNDPRTLEDISLSIDEALWRGISKVWVATDPNVSYASIPAGEIGRMTIAIGLDTSYAFNKDAGSYYAMNCENATSEIRVIDIRVGDVPRVYSEGDCMIIEGKDDVEQSRAADKLAVTWLERLVVSK